jgi:endonuclease YncB( thermonuclease family)
MAYFRHSRWAIVPAAAVFAAGVLAGAAIGPRVSVAPPVAAASPETGQPPKSGPTVGAYAAEVLRVLDGDTFEARVRAWPGIDITTKVRLRGIDAPEMRARCPEERAKAEAARATLTAVLASGHVTISRVGLDRYGGRVDADAATPETSDVSAAMLRSGHARAYDGGRRGSWCEN